MHNNKISYISKKQAEELIMTLNYDNSHHIGIIDGKNAKTWLEYLDLIRQQYHFPTNEDVFDGYLDWMEDLSWLSKNAFSIFIFHYKSFLSKEPKNKKIVMEMFDELISWWSKDADIYWEKGKTKPFNVYLIN